MFGIPKINYNQTSDENLMSLVCNGNRKAFETLYDRYFKKLSWFAFGFLDDKEKAEDAVQEVFIKLIEQPDQFNQERKFSTWLYTVTGNTCRNLLRNEQNRAKLLEENSWPEPSPATDYSHEPDRKILRQQIQKALSDLNEKENTLYSLRFEQELSIREIAGLMQIPEGSVKSGLHYLLKKISIHLKIFNDEK